MKYKVLIDHPTSEGILYKDEIVKEYENKPNGHIRVKDNMGRIWFVPKKILRKIWSFSNFSIYILLLRYNTHECGRVSWCLYRSRWGYKFDYK